jgi:hypothetical protein
MPAIFIPQGLLFRATEHASGPWSPDLLQGSATTALLAREVERLPGKSSFVVRRLTFDLWRPATMRAFATSLGALARRPQSQDTACSSWMAMLRSAAARRC